MAFSQNEISTFNNLAKHKSSTYMVYLFGLGELKGGTATELGFF